MLVEMVSRDLELTAKLQNAKCLLDLLLVDFEVIMSVPPGMYVFKTLKSPFMAIIPAIY